MARGLRRTAFDQSSYDYWTGQYGVVNVKDFGAVGDGVHDDTAAIQRAIDTLRNGGTVFLPMGNYLISRTLTIAAAGITIQGANDAFPNSGMGASNITPIVGSYDVFQITANQPTIKNLAITPADYMTGGYIFNFLGESSSNYLQQPVLKNIFALRSYNGISTVNVQSGLYEHLIFEGVIGPYGWYATNWTLPYLNFVVMASSSASSVMFYWVNVNSLMALNIAQDTAATAPLRGFYMSGVADCTFYSLAVNGCVDSQVYILNSSDLHFDQPYIFYGKSHGIHIESSGNVFVTGADIESNGGSGILLDGGSGFASDIRISTSQISANNQTSGGLQSGIDLINNVSQVGVSNCLIDGNGTQQYGIHDQTTASPAYNTYTGNSIWNNKIGPINASGQKTVTASGNAGYNPVGAISAPASPLASGAVYQNTLPVAIAIYQPAYATTAGTAGTVSGATGPTDTPPAVFTDYVSGGTTDTAPSAVPPLRVPPGWYYSFTTSGATLLDAQIQGE